MESNVGFIFLGVFSFILLILFLVVNSTGAGEEIKEYFTLKSTNKKGKKHLKRLGCRPQTEKEAYEYLKKWIDIDKKIINKDVKCEIFYEHTGWGQDWGTITFSININDSLYSKTISKEEKEILLNIFNLIKVPMKDKSSSRLDCRLFYELSIIDIAILNNIEFYEAEKFVEKYNKKK